MAFVDDKAGLIAATALEAGFQHVNIDPSAAMNKSQLAREVVPAVAAVTTYVPDGVDAVVQMPAPVEITLFFI